MNELALFAGAGGGILGGRLLGWRTICAVEWDAYAASVLVARQNDGCLDPFPIWDDVQTFDGRPWRGIVDLVSGGFPCQDISAAGKGAGIDGDRSSMWRHMARIIGEVRPRFAFVENSPPLVGRGLARVLGDLAAMGYDARWGIVGAHHAGAPHKRERIWIVAESYKERKQGLPFRAQAKHSSLGACGEDVADADLRRCQQRHSGERAIPELDAQGEKLADAASERLEGHGTNAGEQAITEPRDSGSWWRDDPADGQAESRVGRMADGVAARVDRLKCLGNGQVPAVVALAWRTLTSEIG